MQRVTCDERAVCLANGTRHGANEARTAAVEQQPMVGRVGIEPTTLGL